MTKKSLKDRIRAAGEDLLTTRGPQRVLVALDEAEPGEVALERLAGCGLTVEEVHGSKVIGTIDGERLDELRALPEVREVETPTRLRPHA